MCSKYIVNVSTKYGVENIKCGDDYNLAIDKYKEIKQFYENVPCTIKFYNQNDVQFIKTPEKDFDKLYNNLIDAMLDLAKYQVELTKSENKLHEVRNTLYHDLEERDLSAMSDDEQIKYLREMKGELTKRRVTESDNQKNFAFSDCFNQVYNSLCNYVGIREEREDLGRSRYKKTYYTEDMSTKKNRVKKLHSLKR